MRLLSLFLMGLMLLQSTAFAQENPLSAQQRIREQVNAYKKELEVQHLSEEELKDLKTTLVKQKGDLFALLVDARVAKSKLNTLLNLEKVKDKKAYSEELKKRYVLAAIAFVIGCGLVFGARGIILEKEFSLSGFTLSDFVFDYPFATLVGLTGFSQLLMSLGIVVMNNPEQIRSEEISSIANKLMNADQEIQKLESKVNNYLTNKISAIDLILAEQ